MTKFNNRAGMKEKEKRIEQKTATVIGATGLIGSRLMNMLQVDEYFTAIRVISRRQVDFGTSKVEVHVIDFSDMNPYRHAIEGSDAVFCAVGTTQKKTGGDEDAYRKVDYDIPVNAARFCAETGCHQFLLVSSIGANSSSGNFYLKLKGVVEEAVKAVGVTSVAIFRPSVLLGERSELRPGETIGKILMKTFSFLLPSRMKPVYANDVAAAMLAAAKFQKTGTEVYEYREIIRLSQNMELV